MKQKWVFSNFILSMLVVCTIMYQSMHSFVHILEEIQHEKFADGHHEHTSLDGKKCSVCNFTFSPFTPVTFFTLQVLPKIVSHKQYIYQEQSFAASSIIYFSLRGPPIV